MSWNTCLHLTPLPVFLLELPLSAISSTPEPPTPTLVTHERRIQPPRGIILPRDVGGHRGGGSQTSNPVKRPAESSRTWSSRRLKAPVGSGVTHLTLKEALGPSIQPPPTPHHTTPPPPLHLSFHSFLSPSSSLHSLSSAHQQPGRPINGCK